MLERVLAAICIVATMTTAQTNAVWNEYGLPRTPETSLITAGATGEIVIPFNLSDIVNSEHDIRQITVAATATPNTSTLHDITPSSVTRIINLNRLNVNIIGDGDSLRITITDGGGTGQGGTTVTITIPELNQPIVVITRPDGTVTIPLNQLPEGNLLIDVIARKDDFVDGKGTHEFNNPSLRLLPPSIFYLDPNGQRIPANQASVPTNGKIIVVLDYSNITSEEMKSKAHDLIATLTYGGREIERSSVKTNTTGNETIITFDLTGKINSENAAATTITVAGWVNPNLETFFGQSETTTATFNLSRLVVDVRVNDRPVGSGGTTTGANGDVLIINVRDNQGNIRPNADVLITINGRQETRKTDDFGNVRIPFEDLPPVTNLNVSVFAREPGFVDSPTIPFTITNNTDHDAPKIESAHFAFGGYLSNGTRDKDTLTVKFDEPIWWENRSTHLINLWNKDGKLYIMTLTPILGQSGDGRDLWKFVVEPIEGNYRPVSSDSVNINHIAEVRDRWSNYVEEDNPKRPLALGAFPINMTITVIPGGRMLTTNGLSIPLKDIITLPPGTSIVHDIINDDGDGTIIIIDLGFRDGDIEGCVSDEIKRIHAVIIDPVGNIVVQTDDKGQSENMGAVAARMPGGKVVMTAAWNNKNVQGRDVEAGIYTMLIESQLKGNPTVFKDRKFIPVPWEQGISDKWIKTLDDITDTNFMAALAEQINFGYITPSRWNIAEQRIEATGENVLLVSGEISDVTHLDLSNRGIENLNGIENFTSLVYLNVSDNRLTGLDLSNNTALKYLNVSGNKFASKNAITGIANFDEENFIFGTQQNNQNSIKNIQKSDNRQGIKFAINPASDKAEISVILQNNERVSETKIAIYDMIGNVVFSTTARDNASWDLRNTAGRFVANGTYLVIAEVKDRNGKTYQYSAKLGVRR